MSEPIRAVAYYRMSTDKQEDSIDRQRSQVEPYAPKHGYTILRDYMDEGIGGDEVAKRAQFVQMLKDAQRGQFRVILCDDKDRFGRFDSIDYGYYVKPLRDAGVKLVTVAQGLIDWNSFAGRISDTIMQEAKRIESQAISRRVATLMCLMAKKGRWMGGPIPYGYEVLYEDVLEPGKAPKRRPVKLTPGDPAKVRTVQLIYHLYGDLGYSLRAVSRELLSQTIPDPSGKPVWNVTTLRKILRNRKYVGDMPWNTRHAGKYSEIRRGDVNTENVDRKHRHNPVDDWIIFQDAHEALVERALFERVKDRLEENRNRKTPMPQGDPFLLTGLLVCGHCGHRLVGRTFHGKRYYQCGHFGHVGRHGCLGYTIAEDGLLSGIVRKLQTAVLSPENLRQLREELDRQLRQEKATTPAKVTGLQKRIGQLDRKITGGLERMALIDADLLAEYGAMVREWKEERDRLTAELETVQNPPARADLEEALQAAEAHLFRLEEAVQKDEPALVREVLREIISKIELHFTATPRKHYTRYQFQRGVLWVRTHQSFDTSHLFTTVGSGSGKST